MSNIAFRRRTARSGRRLLAATAVLIGATPSFARAQVPAPPAAAGDWPTYNGPLAGDRYSPLTQITRANVGQLRRGCAFDAPDSPPARPSEAESSPTPRAAGSTSRRPRE